MSLSKTLSVIGLLAVGALSSGAALAQAQPQLPGTDPGALPPPPSPSPPPTTGAPAQPLEEDLSPAPDMPPPDVQSAPPGAANAAPPNAAPPIGAPDQGPPNQEYPIPPNVQGTAIPVQGGGYCFGGPHPAPGGGWEATATAHVHNYAPFDLRLFSYRDGCYYFVGDPRDFGYTGQLYSYYGAHPVADGYGGGWCFMVGPHTHWWRPWSPNFTVVGSWYYWNGPYDPFFWAYWPFYSFYYRSYYPHYYAGGRYYRGGFRAAPPITRVPAYAGAGWRAAPAGAGGWRGGAPGGVYHGAPGYHGGAPAYHGGPGYQGGWHGGAVPYSGSRGGFGSFHGGGGSWHGGGGGGGFHFHGGHR
ncbi:MAG: hypothetical protein ACJ8F1_18265 [Polyangia bacterium]